MGNLNDLPQQRQTTIQRLCPDDSSFQNASSLLNYKNHNFNNMNGIPNWIQSPHILNADSLEGYPQNLNQNTSSNNNSTNFIQNVALPSQSNKEFPQVYTSQQPTQQPPTQTQPRPQGSSSPTVVGHKRPRQDIEPESELVEEESTQNDAVSKSLEAELESAVDDIDGNKSSEDGFRWRKYGRKSVKGSKFPRSYYKCTYPGCQVKKQVEVIIKNDTPTITTTYKGTHEHDRPQVTHLQAKDQNSFKNVVVEGFAKQQNSNSNVHANLPRLVVEASKNVNHLDDGYRWRKYGQKHVKGSKFPRSYYKCTETDCLVKKQVDQLENSIINIYEGNHNHSAPCAVEANKRKKLRTGESETSEGNTMTPMAESYTPNTYTESYSNPNPPNPNPNMPVNNNHSFGLGQSNSNTLNISNGAGSIIGHRVLSQSREDYESLLREQMLGYHHGYMNTNPNLNSNTNLISNSNLNNSNLNNSNLNNINNNNLNVNNNNLMNNNLNNNPESQLLEQSAVEYINQNARHAPVSSLETMRKNFAMDQYNNNLNQIQQQQLLQQHQQIQQQQQQIQQQHNQMYRNNNNNNNSMNGGYMMQGGYTWNNDWSRSGVKEERELYADMYAYPNSNSPM